MQGIGFGFLQEQGIFIQDLWKKKEVQDSKNHSQETYEFLVPHHTLK